MHILRHSGWTSGWRPLHLQGAKAIGRQPSHTGCAPADPPVRRAVAATAGRSSGQRLCDFETPFGFADDLLGDYTTDVEPALLCLPWPGFHFAEALPVPASLARSSSLIGRSLCPRTCAAELPPGAAAGALAWCMLLLRKACTSSLRSSVCEHWTARADDVPLLPEPEGGGGECGGLLRDVLLTSQAPPSPEPKQSRDPGCKAWNQRCGPHLALAHGKEPSCACLCGRWAPVAPQRSCACREAKRCSL